MRYSNRRNRRAAVTVEMSITLPILILLFVAMVFFVRCYMLQSSAEMAAYSGAREGIIFGSTTSDIRQAAVSHLNLVGVSRFEVDVNRTPESVRVTIRIPLSGNSWGTAYLFPDSFSMTGMCQLKRLGN